MLIENLFFCPVKSISFTEVKNLKIIANQGIENDRIFAFVQNQDQNKIELLINNPGTRKLNNFVTLKNNPELNKYNFVFINNKLILRENKKEILSINPYSTEQQIIISKKIRNLIHKENKIDFVIDKKNPFFDTMPNNSISLININSINHFENKIFTKIEFERFRGNIYVNNLNPWEERSWVGKTIKINNINFFVTSEIPRCSATNLKPHTDNQTLNLPNMLKKTYNHINMGVYLIPKNNGTISIENKIHINE